MASVHNFGSGGSAKQSVIDIVPMFGDAVNDGSSAIIIPINTKFTTGITAKQAKEKALRDDERYNARASSSSPSSDADEAKVPENKGATRSVFAGAWDSVKGKAEEFSDKRASIKEQKNRIIHAAYLNSATGTQASVEQWIKKNFKNGTVADFAGDSSLKVDEKAVLKHLNGNMLRGLSKGQRQSLSEARTDHLKEQANAFFDDYGSARTKAAPESIGRLSVSWKNPMSVFGLMANGAAAAVDGVRNKRTENYNVKEEQKERLLTAAFMHSKTTNKADVRAWLEKANENDTLNAFAGDHNKLKVDVDDVMNQFRSMSRAHKAELVEGRDAFLKRDVAAETSKAFNAFDMG